MLQQLNPQISYHFWLCSSQLRAGSKSCFVCCAACQCQFQVSADDFGERCTQFPGSLLRTSRSFQSFQSILPKKRRNWVTFMNTLQNSHSSASFTNTVELHTPNLGQQTTGTVTKCNCSATAQKLHKANPILQSAEAKQEDSSLLISLFTAITENWPPWKSQWPNPGIPNPNKLL